MITKEIHTCILTLEKLWLEIFHIVDYFKSKDVRSCQILFGWAWGMEYYSELEWQEEEILLNDLVKKIHTVEKMNIGQFTKDDVFIKIGDLSFNFCHESDIHLVFDVENDITKHFFDRWKSLGFEPRIKEIRDREK